MMRHLVHMICTHGLSVMTISSPAGANITVSKRFRRARLHPTMVTDQGAISSPPGTDRKTGWQGLAQEILHYSGKGLWKVFMLVALAAVLEAFGLAMLLPIAEIIVLEAPVTGFSARLLEVVSGFGAVLWWQRMAVLFTLFFALMLVRAFVIMQRDITLTQLSQGFVDYIRVSVISTLAHMAWPDIRRLRKADMLASLTSNIGRVGSAMRFVTQSSVTFVLIIAYLVMAFVISPAAGLLLLLMVGCAGLVAMAWFARSKRLGKRLNTGNQRIAQEMTRFLDSLKIAKAMQAEDAFVSRFAEAAGRTRTMGVTFSAQQARLRRGVELVAAAAAMLLIAIGYGALGLGASELLLVGAVVLRLVSVVTASLSGLQGMAYALPAFDEAQALRHSAKPVYSNAAAEDAAAQAPRAHASVISSDHGAEGLSLDNLVIFADSGNPASAVIRSGTIALPRHGLVLLCGPSGAGKTMLVDVLAGLQQADAGQVCYDGITLSPDTLAQWQRIISYVPQGEFLFDGTLRDNLLWPDHVADDDALWAALDTVRLGDGVRGFAQGLDEPLRDAGSRLSGGERQRLSLARALLKPSRLLIIDEGLSALDPDLALHVIASLRGVADDRLVLLISHVTEHRQVADMLLTIADGRISVADKSARQSSCPPAR